MIKFRIFLKDMKDFYEFVHIASGLQGKVVINNGTDYQVDGKSLVGVLYCGTFDEMWCEVENSSDYEKLNKFGVNK